MPRINSILVLIWEVQSAHVKGRFDAYPKVAGNKQDLHAIPSEITSGDLYSATPKTIIPYPLTIKLKYSTVL